MAKLKNGVQATSQIYAVLTDRGAELEAAALATGVPVTLSQFCIGDANGQEEVTPDPARTALIHEVYRGNITASTNQDNQVTFTLDVPTTTGGYTIREIGILTDNGELYSVARSPDILKPTDSNGALISITYKYTLAVSSTSTITVVVYDDYLTPDAADKKYLQINENLSEIKNNGADAQKSARENIGIAGDVAFRDESNTFTEDNTFDKSVELKGGMHLWGHIGLWSSGGVGCGSIDMYRGADNGSTLQLSTTAVTDSKNIHYRFVMSHKDGMVVNVANEDYVVWNALNYTPVRTVNNVKPDSSGNVDTTTSSSGDVGAVGSYALMCTSTLGAFKYGVTVNGSYLRYASMTRGEAGDVIIETTSSPVPSGTWIMLSDYNSGGLVDGAASLMQRVA